MRLTLLHGLAGHMVEPGAQDGDLCRTHSRPTPYHASQGVATGMGGAEVAGAYTDPPLSGPRGMCEDAHGNLWVANTEAANILRWDAETGKHLQRSQGSGRHHLHHLHTGTGACGGADIYQSVHHKPFPQLMLELLLQLSHTSQVTGPAWRGLPM